MKSKFYQLLQEKINLGLPAIIAAIDWEEQRCQKTIEDLTIDEITVITIFVCNAELQSAYHKHKRGDD